MSDSFSKKTSNFFITLLIGLIVVSFMFTGYESMGGASGSIATVGSYPITPREYDNEYNRQVNFYKNALLGGKNLTAKDIERFGIKRQALNNLVQRKTRVVFADMADQHVSPESIKKTVKEFEFFQTNGSFDLNRYKLLLQSNRMTPSDFEEDMKNNIKSDMAMKLIGQMPISNGYMNDIRNFKMNRFQAHIIELSKNKLKSKISVSSSEVSKFLQEAANKARVESLFKQRKESLDIKEKVKASHILIKGDDSAALKKIQSIAKKVNPKNFKKVANKETQDPSGKGNGGSLGEFTRGRMVPEFDQVAFTQKPGTISKPVKTSFGYHLIYVEKKIPAKQAKLAKHQSKIARELIRDEKTQELDKLFTSVKEEAMAAMNKADFKRVKSLRAKYGITYDENVEINPYDGSKGNINLDKDASDQLMASIKEKESAVIDLSKGNKIQIVTYQKNYNKDLPMFDLEKEKSGLQNALSQKLRQEVIKTVGEKIKVKQHVNL